MSSCPTCGNRDYLCQRCKMEALEERYGTGANQTYTQWVLEDGLWHASTGLDGDTHGTLCDRTIATPVEWSTDDLRYVTETYDAPVCRECVVTVTDDRLETLPEDATFERASTLRADGGGREADLVDRAVREARTLIDAGDADQVAIDYVVDELNIEHRRDDVRERLEREIATDGGVDYDAIRAEVPFFLRRSNSRGARAAIHLPADDATRDDPAVRCRYNSREGVTFRPQPTDATPDWQLDKHGCSECFGADENSPTPDYGRSPADVLAEAGLTPDDEEDDETSTVLPDGGRRLEGREAFLAGESHWCDLCSQPFDRIDKLANHECRPVRADGGESQHRASCEDCPWSYQDSDLVDVSDEMDRHARKEMHDVDLERAVATDGGCVQSRAGGERNKKYRQRNWNSFTLSRGDGLGRFPPAGLPETVLNRVEDREKHLPRKRKHIADERARSLQAGSERDSQ